GLVNAEEFGLSREGYHFVGWGIDTDDSVVFDPNNVEIRPHDLLCENETYIPDWNYKEITLYAIWVPAYTVTFKFNGGTYNDTVSIHNDIYTLTNVPEGASISLITAEKEGYILSYWGRTVPKSTEKYGAESLYEVTCDTTFVAHWAVKSPNENTQNIFFDLNYDNIPKNLFAAKSNTQNGITATLNVNSNSIKLNGASSELSETQYYFNPVLNAGDYLSGATNLRVIVTHNSGNYFGSNLYFRVQANSETESFKKHNLLLSTEGVSTLDISLSDDGIINPKEITSLSCSIVSDNEVAVVLNNYDISIKILAVPKEENKYDNMTLPLGQMVIKNTVWSGNTSIPQRPGYNFVGWSTDKSEYKAFNTSSLISDDVILYAIWVKNSANVVNVRFDENYKEVTPNLYTVDTYNGQLWTEEYETLYENGFPQNVKTQYTTYIQSDSYGVRVDLYPNKNRIRLSGTLKEGTFTVPLSSLNLTLNKSDYFHLLIQKYGSYSLDMNFKNAFFCVDVYDELGNELSSLCARINLADIKQGMPAAYSISSEQIKELIGEKEFVNLRFNTYIGFDVKEGTTASLSSPFNNSKFDIAVTAKIN
ncbi:MAG: InlB B-repeat-containing protein, partial [Clostridia bacterium]|nr:InlB B-repeat-containing protein [Clostridia bacterium]